MVKITLKYVLVRVTPLSYKKITLNTMKHQPNCNSMVCTVNHNSNKCVWGICTCPPTKKSECCGDCDRKKFESNIPNRICEYCPCHSVPKNPGESIKKAMEDVLTPILQNSPKECHCGKGVDCPLFPRGVSPQSWEKEFNPLLLMEYREEKTNYFLNVEKLKDFIKNLLLTTREEARDRIIEIIKRKGL